MIHLKHFQKAVNARTDKGTSQISLDQDSNWKNIEIEEGKDSYLVIMTHNIFITRETQSWLFVVVYTNHTAEVLFIWTR